MNAITFDTGSKEAILKIFGMSVDDAGYIVEGSRRVICSDGNPITIIEFSGMYMDKSHKLVLIKSNFIDLFDVVDKIQKGKHLLDQFLR